MTPGYLDARVFARKGTEKDERSLQIEEAERAKFEKDMADEIKIVLDSAHDRVRKYFVGATTTAKLVDDKGTELLAKGQKISNEDLDQIPHKYWQHIEIDKDKGKTDEILEQVDDQVDAVKMLFQEKIDKLGKGDELPPGVIKMVKVYVAIKRKLSVGDKMAGRHGNKGVLSRILPEEDMPYMEDGTPVEIVLNPLGVPSRMNVGQILETHLGLASRFLGEQIQAAIESMTEPKKLRKQIKDLYGNKELNTFIDELTDEDVHSLARRLSHGIPMASPVFEGVHEDQIKTELERSGMPLDGQMVLHDGRTGEAFKEKVTVGIMYMLKLHHLVDDKIHARSIGPYSLVTQQPLGGKAQFGGQRFGEMEVWALEAYGAAKE